MRFVHYDFELGSNDVVKVSLDKQATVRLLDAANFQRFCRGHQHHYYGRLATSSPVLLRPPHAGHWHVVVDLGGYNGTVRTSARVV